MKKFMLILVAVMLLGFVGKAQDFSSVNITGNANAKDIPYGLFGQANVGLGIASIHGGIGGSPGVKRSSADA